MADPADLSTLDHPEMMSGRAGPASQNGFTLPTRLFPDQNEAADSTGGMQDMIALGLEEPMPTSDITDDLYAHRFHQITLHISAANCF